MTLSCGCVWGGEGKIRCCEQHRNLGTRNVRSLNQGKLEAVKQEMARVNIYILGISELNGQEWASLIQMNIIPTTVSKNPLKEVE